MIDDALRDLRRDEGWRPFVYDDATGKPIVKGSVVIGHPTIGFGECVAEDRGAGLPIRIGEELLRHGATTRWNALVRARPWLLDQPEDVQRALVCMAYQLGVNGVLNFKKMMRALETGDRWRAYVEALDSQWSINHPRRSKRIADLIKGY